MKKLSLLSLMLVSLLSIQAQKINEQKIKSEVNAITIYLEGAEINRTKAVKLQPGKNRIIFEGLSPQLNSKSIRVKSEKEIDILSITNTVDYLYKEELSPRIKQLKDSLVLIKRKITQHNDDLDAYQTEKNLLIKNQNIGGEQNGVAIGELTTAADFYRTRIKEINKNKSDINFKISELNKVKYRITNQLIEMNHKSSYQRGEVSILLNSATDMTTNIELLYLVNSTGWMPVYDIKADEINKPITLVYRAKVFNNTEIDWNDVNIKLSTADPNMNASKPSLDPWYLNYYSTNTYSDNRLKGYVDQYLAQETQQIADEIDYKSDLEGLFEDENMPDRTIEAEDIAKISSIELKKRRKNKMTQKVKPMQVMVQISELSAEFEIKNKYSIPADANPYFMEVETHNLPATYKHFTAPKQDRNAFLLARVTDWEDLNLVSGFANIYFNKTFVGRSFINTAEVNDTLDISLGRDNKVLVTRTKQKDFSSKHLIGTNRKEVQAFEIIVKNNRKTPIDIEIIDQIPISQDSDIEVNKMEISDAAHNEITGELKWDFTIAPAQNEKVNLSFSIKYPKNKPIKTKKQAYRSMNFF